MTVCHVMTSGPRCNLDLIPLRESPILIDPSYTYINIIVYFRGVCSIASQHSARRSLGVGCAGNEGVARRPATPPRHRRHHAHSAHQRSRLGFRGTCTADADDGRA